MVATFKSVHRISRSFSSSIPARDTSQLIDYQLVGFIIYPQCILWSPAK